MQPMPSGCAQTVTGGGYGHQGRAAQARARLTPAIALLLAACSSAPGSDPIAWWRQLEGGRLAEERPLPPRADDPYPNLGSVPARPAATEAAARARIAAGLAVDQRDGAHAVAQPIAPLNPARPAPQPAPGGAIGASLAAASAAPAPAPAPPTPAPVTAPAPAPRPPMAPAPAPSIADAAATLPSGPPPAPRLPGVATATAPTRPRQAPTPPPPAAAPFVPGAPVGIAFAAGSAILPEGAAAALRQLAASRSGHDIQIAGYGDGAAPEASAQAATLPLAFARARAIASARGQAGVPDDALRVTGEAIGRGGVARVVE